MLWAKHFAALCAHVIHLTHAFSLHTTDQIHVMHVVFMDFVKLCLIMRLSLLEVTCHLVDNFIQFPNFFIVDVAIVIESGVFH